MKKYVDSFRKSDTNNALESTKISPSEEIHVQNKQETLRKGMKYD